MEGSNSNKTITSSIDEESRNLTDAVDRKDTSLIEETCMVNPIIPTNTYEPNEDTKMMESSVDEKIIEKDTIDLVSPSTKVFPDVLFDSESTKEKRWKLRLWKTVKKLTKIFQVLGGCPMYCLTVSQQRKIKQNFLQVHNQQHQSTM